MRMNGCISWTLAGILFILFVYGVSAEDKDEQFSDSSTADDNVLKAKRPFCNAFTGCGKKRSYYGNSMEQQDNGEWVTIRLPIFLYQALIQVATRQIREAIERKSILGTSSSAGVMMGQDYSSYPSSRKFPSRKQYDR